MEDNEGSEGSSELNELNKDDFEMAQDAFDNPYMTGSPSSYMNDNYDSPNSSPQSSDSEVCIKQEDLSDIYSNTIFSGGDALEEQLEVMNSGDDDVWLLKRATDDSLWTATNDFNWDDLSSSRTDKYNSSENFYSDLISIDDFQIRSLRTQPPVPI